MDVDDYAKADCGLFRHGYIDLSSVDDRIEDILIRAWRNGSGLEEAIESLTADRRLVRLAEGQLAESLNFRKAVAEKDLEERKREIISSYEDQYKSSLQQLTQKQEEEKRYAQERLQAVKAGIEQNYTQYSHAQRSLEQLRERVRSDLGQIGEEKYMIVAQLTGTDPIAEVEEIVLPTAVAPRQKAGLYTRMISFFRGIFGGDADG